MGVQFDNNPQAKWFIDFAGWGGKEAVTGTKGADLIYSAVGFGAKTLLKKVINGKNIVSWLAEWFKNGVENFTDNEGSFWDNVRETLAEGASGGMVALVTAGITAAVIAAVGIAPAGIGAAIVGAGASIIVEWASNILSEQMYHNEEGFVENVGDSISNWFEQLGL